MEFKKTNLFRVLKNTIALLGNKVLTGVINLIFISCVARYLSQDGFGMFSTILAFLAFANIFADFGLSTVVTREIAKDKTKAPELYGNSIFLSIGFSLLAWIGMVIIAFYLGYSKQMMFLIVLSGFTIFFNSVISRLTAILSGFEKMEIFSVVGVVLSVFFTILGILFLRLGLNLGGMILLMILGTGVTSLVLFYIVQKDFVKFKPRFDRKIVNSLLKQAFPLFALIGLSILLRRMDIIMLSKMKTMQDVGIYGVAVQLNEALGVATGCFMGAMLPFISSQSKSSLENTYPIYLKSMRVMIIFSSFLTVALFLLSGQIVPFVFGKEFALSSQVFRILIWSFLLNHFAGPMGLFLIVQKEKLKILMLGSLLIICANFILNLILIPQYGYIGASATTVFCGFLVLIMKSRLFRESFKNSPSLISLIFKPAFAAVLAGGIIFFLKDMFFLIPFFVGLFCYFIFLIMFGELKIEKISEILNLLKVTR
ncbi:MAG: flippase [PVC group bacterium]|nr:flippase [PVC group bacterium]